MTAGSTPAIARRQKLQNRSAVPAVDVAPVNSEIIPYTINAKKIALISEAEKRAMVAEQYSPSIR